MTTAILLMMVGTFMVRVVARVPSGYTNVPSWLLARDRWELITGFVIAVTAFAIVTLPLDVLVIPETTWLIGVGLLAGGVFGAVLRWPELAWYAGTHPLRRMIGVIATLCICLLIIVIAVM